MTDTDHRPRQWQEWAGEPPACVCGALWPCPTPTPTRGTPPPVTRTDPLNVPRLCPACLVALGYWTDPAGLCPRCAAIEKEAGE